MGEEEMTTKKALLVVGVVLALGLGGYVWYLQTHMLLTGTSPKKGQEVATIDPITFTFNKALAPGSQSRFSISPSISGKGTVDGKTFTFTPDTQYTFGTTYTLTFKEPTSDDGYIGKTIVYTFKPGFVKSPTKEQLKTQLNRTDNVTRLYPILKYVPHETVDYKIDYKLLTFGGGENDSEESNTQSVTKPVLTITLYATMNRPDQASFYQQQLKDYKQEALKYLKDSGFNPTDLEIRYEPSEAANL